MNSIDVELCTVDLTVEPFYSGHTEDRGDFCLNFFEFTDGKELCKPYLKSLL